MKSVCVVGGEMKPDAARKEHWRRGKKGRILCVDPATREVDELISHVSPSETCADDDPSIHFSAATVSDDTLYACTKTEVLTYRLPTCEQIGYVSLPCFNDVHHVRPTGRGTLYVATTGLDMVVEIDGAGKIIEEWNVLGEDPWARFSRDTDYRKIGTTKPHRAHPNYVFLYKDQLWVTRFQQRDAVCLNYPDLRIEIGTERPHDGRVLEDRVYFTTVDGHVVVADMEELKVLTDCDLNRIEDSDFALGWCRGLLPIDREHVLVGFSRLRQTKIRENLRWLHYRVGGRENAGIRAARIALYNIARGEKIWEKELEEHGLNIIYSIHWLGTEPVETALESFSIDSGSPYSHLAAGTDADQSRGIAS